MFAFKIEELNEEQAKKLFENLSDEQIAAYNDVTRPTYIINHNYEVGRTYNNYDSIEELNLDDLEVYDSEIIQVSEDPRQKWGWNDRGLYENTHEFKLKRIKELDQRSTEQTNKEDISSNSRYSDQELTRSGSRTFGNTQEAIGVSFPGWYRVWEWTCTIHWDWEHKRYGCCDYWGENVSNTSYSHRIDYTSMNTDYQGTSIYDRNEEKEYIAEFQATFHNRKTPGGVIDETFNPYMKLSGDAYGSGTVVENDCDVAWSGLCD